MKTSFTPMRAAFVALFCEAFLYGTYTTLFAWTTYLFWKRESFASTWLGTLIRILTILLYAISTTHLALAFAVAYHSFAVEGDADPVYSDFDMKKNALNLVQTKLYATNGILADIILTWRAWVLCNRNMKVLVLPGCLLVCTIVMAAMVLKGLSENDGSGASFNVIFGPSVAPWTYGLACSVLMTNVLCTGLISWKVIVHQRTLKKAGLGHIASTYRWIALIIVESGSLYLTAWILFILFAAIDHPAIFVITDMLSQLTGIVPTLVIVLVSMKADSSSVHIRLTSASSELTRPAEHYNNSSRSSTFVGQTNNSSQKIFSSAEQKPEFELKVRVDTTTSTSWADDTVRVVDIRGIS